MGRHDVDRTPVTVIGLGHMGRALADTLLREGYPTTVWNRSPAKADDLVARGARLAPSVADAVSAGALVLVCVTDYAAVRELLDPPAATLSGRTLVNLTTGTSREARETAAWAAGHGANYLDGAILGAPTAIGTPEGVILYSGPPAAFERHEAALRSLGGGTAYLGADQGLSALYDASMLGLMWGILNGFLQGAALLDTAGVSAGTFAPVARQGLATVAEWLAGYATQIDEGRYPVLDASIDTHLASMEHLVHESESLGVDAAFPRLVRAVAERAVADGHGGSGYAALIEQLRAPAGTRP
ncbi:6-phosphogluconate dehydrogenase [Embleya scabrispora]|uniref:6-phosphogluconate dehydrogenase n=1 Tax=Embleya scabrispora TaxID=159449 RepID=A0A1T3NRK0_9ACTN|nr:NAD(P)-binding domain-containing protein [Embleya scabrispora]OPC79365.1 6-phosphogluconate dehydrogenase [Embleya scabrispora]